jgi:hypothetical protein
MFELDELVRAHNSSAWLDVQNEPELSLFLWLVKKSESAQLGAARELAHGSI